MTYKGEMIKLLSLIFIVTIILLALPDVPGYVQYTAFLLFGIFWMYAAFRYFRSLYRSQTSKHSLMSYYMIAMPLIAGVLFRQEMTFAKIVGWLG